MIKINDEDLPICAAEKIISGTDDTNHNDMYDLDEIKEIADYLMVYYRAHIKADETAIFADNIKYLKDSTRESEE